MKTSALFLGIALFLCCSVTYVSARTEADSSSKALVATSASSSSKAATKVKLEPFTIGILITSIVIACANIAVEMYKAHLMSAFKNRVKEMQAEVGGAIKAAVEKFQEVVTEVEAKATALGGAMKASVKKDDTNNQVALMLLQMEKSKTAKSGGKTTIEVAGNMIFETTSGESDADWARDTAAGMLKNYPKMWANAVFNGAVVAKNFAVSQVESTTVHVAIEAIAKEIGQKALGVALEQVLSVVGVLSSLTELVFNIGKALELKKTMKQLYPEYESEMIEGPAKDARYLMCKAISSMHKTTAEDGAAGINKLKAQSGAKGKGGPADKLKELLQVMQDGFDSDELKCGDFVSYPAKPKDVQPICRIYAPAEWTYDDDHQGVAAQRAKDRAAFLQVAAGAAAAASTSSSSSSRVAMRLRERSAARALQQGQSSSSSSSLATSLAGKGSDGSGYENDRFLNPFDIKPPLQNGGVVHRKAAGAGVPQGKTSPMEDGEALCGHVTTMGSVRRAPAPRFPAGCTCDNPVTSVQQMYGSSMNDRGANPFGIITLPQHRLRPVLTSGHFGMRLYTPVLMGNKQSAQTKFEEMQLREKGTKDLVGEINSYFYYESSYHEDVDIEFVAEQFNFVKHDPACRLEGGKACKDGSKTKGKTKQGFLLTTYSKGAPVVQLKASCSASELKKCAKGGKFGTCGWRRAPKVWFVNTEPGFMEYCFLKAWHVNALA